MSEEKYVVVAFSDLPPLRTLEEAIEVSKRDMWPVGSHAKVLKIVDIDKLLPIGTVVEWIVGAPGPDYDLAIITGYESTGQYRIRFKVWGQGDWLDGVTGWAVRPVTEQHAKYYTYYNDYVEEAKKFVNRS